VCVIAGAWRGIPVATDEGWGSSRDTGGVTHPEVQGERGSAERPLTHRETPPLHGAHPNATFHVQDY